MKESILRIAICEEDFQDSRRLEDILEEFKKERFYVDIFIKKYRSSVCLMDKLSDCVDYDVLFLGLKAEDKNNINMLKAVTKMTKAKIIIIADKSNDLALAAFELNVTNYVLKPVNKNVLFHIINKIMNSMKIKKAKSVRLNSSKGMINIPYYKILFVDTKSHVVFFHLIDGTVISSKTSRESFDNYIKSLLKDDRFLRCHYSFVVNMNYIKTIIGKEVKLCNGEVIPVSNSKIKETKKISKNFWIGN